MDPLVQTLLQSGAQLTDAALERLLPGPETLPHSIHRAMRHSTFAGGKRLRPILCLEAARMVAHHTRIAAFHAAAAKTGIGAIAGTMELPQGAAELGAALEMLHTYSLIHDDLPALDNDDLRRGQPTCHVVFGEAIAILAGDALQTLAFQTIASLEAPPATVVAILRDVSVAVGTGVGTDLPGKLPPGMIGGQVVDIESEGKPPTAELVESIHRAKTGALITTSIVSGGLLGASVDPSASPPTRSTAFVPSAKKPASPSRSSTTSSTSPRTPPSSAKPPAKTPPASKPPGPPSSASKKIPPTPLPSPSETPKPSSPTPSPRSLPSVPPPLPSKPSPSTSLPAKTSHSGPPGDVGCKLPAMPFRLASLLLTLVICATALGQNGGTLLVANQKAHTLSVIDPVAAKEVASIPITGIAGHEVATSPDNRTAFVPIYGDSGVGRPGTDGQTLLVVDIPTRSITRTVDFGHPVRPHLPIYDRSRNLLFVSTELDQAITAIDPQDLQDRLHRPHRPARVPHVHPLPQRASRLHRERRRPQRLRHRP